uniref:Anaphase-promoting complex subunit 4 n=1 Tax=Diabrotica virgifera virgifera TaxID=50390 RepID=A0A6P7GPL0_DIAVI
MSTFHAIKQLEDKNVPVEISNMVWSDRMDLVALSNMKGEVALHRLSWTKAWNLSPPKENVEVNAMAWRPDGKVLAIGYNSGEVVLVGIENKKTLNIKDLGAEITCLSWVQEKTEAKSKESFTLKEERPKNYMEYIDLSKLYLKDPVPISNADTSNAEEVKETNFMQDQTDLNLLLIGTKKGHLHIRIFGCFTCVILNMTEFLETACSIEHVQMSEDLSKIFVTVKDPEFNVKMVVLESQIFKTHTQELFCVALKYVKLIDLITYLKNTITDITETWESFLLEIDNKLSKYAKKVPEGGVTADFLDLLMFGICSPELEEFLITDLTKKGLEKFGKTIEMSYANMQILLMRHVTRYGQNITYHLAELRGMSRLAHRYEVIGLKQEQITASVQSAGSFLIKAGEIQQIINHSIINYKAFFRWLYGAILFLMDETIPSEVHKIAQQDLAYITEFLQNFDHIGNKDGSNTKGFIMERLGQYLVDAPLVFIPNMDSNDWTTFLNESKCVQKHRSILKHNKTTSLIQQFKELSNSVNDIFEAPKDALQEQFKYIHTFDCFNFGEARLRTTSINISKEVLLFSYLEPSSHIFVLEIHVNDEKKCQARCGKFYFTHLPEETADIYEILDLAFYSNSILSLLLQEKAGNKSGTLLQFSLSLATEKLTEIEIHTEISKSVIFTSNGSSFNPKLYKSVEMAASSFAVSGSRRVSIVLSENKRKVKLFEMEAEEEDDEEADASSSMLKDDSVQENVAE